MKVSEIKALAPLADVYELKPEARYIVVIDPAERRQVVDDLQSVGREANIKGVIIAASEPIQFFEMGE
jgi:hypothetical protein